MNLPEARWSYLSPTRVGWCWISGTRADARKLIARDVAPTRDDVDVTLGALESAARLSQSLQTELLMLVSEAHHRGVTWNDISRRLGGSRQKIHRRYQRQVHAPSTRSILGEDLWQAVAHAHRILERGVDRREITEAMAFLRQFRGTAKNCRTPIQRGVVVATDI